MTKHSATVTRPHNSRFLLLRSVARRSNLTGNSLNAMRRYSTVRSRRPLCVRACVQTLWCCVQTSCCSVSNCRADLMSRRCCSVCVSLQMQLGQHDTTRHTMWYNAIWRWGIGLLAAEMKTKGVEISDEDLSAARDSLRRAQEGCGAVLMREVVLAQQTLS